MRAQAPSQAKDGGEGTVVVGFSGRWSIEKNPLGFVEIAAACGDHEKLRFVMTGAGNLRNEVAEAVARLDPAPGRFHLLGAVPDLVEVLPGYDMLVVPSTLDGRPVVILEALACGVPVVASRVGGIPELVHDGRNGVLCEPGDTAAFAAAITSLADDPARLAAMKREARALAERELDIRAMLDGYAEALATTP